MTEQEIKALLSTAILNNIKHHGDVENVVRRIVYSPNNIINWQEVYEIIKDERPDLRLE